MRSLERVNIRTNERTNVRTYVRKYVLTYIRTGQTLYPLHNFVVRGDNKCQGGETESVKHYALHSYFRSTKWQWSNDVLIRALKYIETGQ